MTSFTRTPAATVPSPSPGPVFPTTTTASTAAPCTPAAPANMASPFTTTTSTATTAAPALSTLTTPVRCTADFSLIPIGTQNASYSQQVANIQRLLTQSGLKFQLHATGTTLEGTWDQVVQVIGLAHTLVHQSGVARIQTDIRITTRTDKVQPMEGNVTSVQRILAA